MCAIAGIFGVNASSQRLNNLLSVMSHRGEAAYQNDTYVIKGQAAIGMHRLGIVDEQYGKQPVFNKGNTIFCVFNGEIYNYKSLGDEISGTSGLSLYSESEVILNAYINWGEEFVKKLDGKFAIAIIDLIKQDVFLARDHMGVKPLYICHNNGSISFASEIKALVDVLDDKQNKNIISLQPGEYWTQGKSNKYFNFPKLNSHISSDLSMLPAIRQSLEDAVYKRIPRNAHKIACLLSGGIDSSIITYIASRQHKDVIAYTLNIAGEESSDYKASKLLCDAFDIKHVVVSPSIQEMQDFYLQHGVYMTESFEPILVRNAVSYYFVCKHIAKDGFKYALTGEGADELFGGYDFIKHVDIDQQDSLIQHSLDIISQTYLKMSDRASMYATLEARVPFMDKNFVTLCSNLPKNYRLSTVQNKVALRYMYSNVLPLEINQRKKLGMNHGSGFGINNSEASIYYQAISDYYESNPKSLVDDLATVSLWNNKFMIDNNNIEEVYNFTKYIQYGYQQYVNRDRLQLNGSLIKTIKNRFALS